jgi:hypothetical protein
MIAANASVVDSLMTGIGPSCDAKRGITARLLECNGITMRNG